MRHASCFWNVSRGRLVSKCPSQEGSSPSTPLLFLLLRLVFLLLRSLFLFVCLLSPFSFFVSDCPSWPRGLTSFHCPAPTSASPPLPFPLFPFSPPPSFLVPLRPLRDSSGPPTIHLPLLTFLLQLFLSRLLSYKAPGGGGGHQDASPRCMTHVKADVRAHLQLGRKLLAAGFKPLHRSIIILEGLQYLLPEVRPPNS